MKPDEPIKISDTRGGDAPQGSQSAPFNHASRFARAHNRQTFYFLIAVGSLVISLIAVVYVTMGKRPKPLVMAVDGTRTIHISPLEDLRGDGPIFSAVAIEATIASMTRSPQGIVNRELFERLFLPEAQEIMRAHLREHMKDIEPRNLRMFPEIATIETLQEEGEVRIINVTGQLNISGSFRGYAIAETEPFSIVYAFVPNPSLALNGMYPFVVTNVKVKEPDLAIADK